jgi:peptide/nickel transport system permease protein
MSESETEAVALKRARGGGTARVLRGAVRTRRGKVGATLAVLVFGIAFLGPFVPTVSPTAFVATPFGPPGNGGPLGGDVLGRDVTSRVLDGGWLILTLAILATVLGVSLGAFAGVVAAYRRGWWDTAIMRSTDVALALPQLVFVLLILSLIGPKLWLLVLAVGLSQAPQVARVAYSAAQDVCERDFVKAVAVWGVAPRAVIRRHVLPNLVTPLMVETGLRLSYSVILISGLAFLGFGTAPPAADWGVMINENRLGLSANPWGVVAPALLLAILSVGTNTFADAIARANLGEGRSEEAVVASALGASVEK